MPASSMRTVAWPSQVIVRGASGRPCAPRRTAGTSWRGVGADGDGGRLVMSATNDALRQHVAASADRAAKRNRSAWDDLPGLWARPDVEGVDDGARTMSRFQWLIAEV